MGGIECPSTGKCFNPNNGTKGKEIYLLLTLGAVFLLKVYSLANSTQNADMFRTKLVVRGNITISTKMRLNAHVNENVSLFLFLQSQTYVYTNTERVTDKASLLMCVFYQKNGENKGKC